MVPSHLYKYYSRRMVRYSYEQSEGEELIMECGCGRSPTGKCIGWHALSEEEYENELNKLQAEEEEKDVSENED